MWLNPSRSLEGESYLLHGHIPHSLRINDFYNDLIARRAAETVL